MWQNYLRRSVQKNEKRINREKLFLKMDSRVLAKLEKCARESPIVYHKYASCLIKKKSVICMANNDECHAEANCLDKYLRLARKREKADVDCN
jgi:hypothetical protein